MQSGFGLFMMSCNIQSCCIMLFIDFSSSYKIPYIADENRALDYGLDMIFLKKDCIMVQWLALQTLVLLFFFGACGN
jgi:hypothetical protein